MLDVVSVRSEARDYENSNAESIHDASEEVLCWTEILNWSVGSQTA